jgi:hypothetical protein
VTRNAKRRSDGIVRDATEFAQGLADKYLHCRELGHVWKDNTVQWDPKAKAYDRSLVCRNCGMIRRQVLNRGGHVLSNSYKYPPGYLATDVQDRTSLSRDVFRLESITRWLDRNTAKAG